MPWRVGIDEAGYGPNLGPLVLGLTACHVPEGTPDDLWTVLSSGVRRKIGRDDGRLLIDDSKKVHTGIDANAKLERGLLSMLHVMGVFPRKFSELLDHRALGESIADLLGEPWYRPDAELPVFDHPDKIASAADILREASSSAKLEWASPRMVVVPAPRFNAQLDDLDLKSEVLILGIHRLFKSILELPGNDAIYVAVDRLGGRTSYGPLLQETFADAWVRTIQETPAACDYSIYNLGRDIHFHFQPKADGEHLNVALASMLAKYLREVFMTQFNAYWSQQVPGIKPTAGYPVDALRFFANIEETVNEQRIPKNQIWRRK